MNEVDEYDAIRRRVEQRFQHRYAFYAHVAVYTLVNLIFWLVWFFTSGMAWQIRERFPIIGDLYLLLVQPWPLVMMAVWGIILIAHGMNYYIRYGDGAIRRRIAINRAIEREMAQYTTYEKPKNDLQLRLTDDGELEAVEDEPNVPMKRKHQ